MNANQLVITKQITAFIAGGTFALGLLVSGMANPNKVLAFLDVTGVWDPSLIFVMAGAIPIAYLAFRQTSKKQVAILGEYYDSVKKTTIDLSLIIGSSLFGIGWGLSGICPGPSIVVLGLNLNNGWIFFVALLTGMLINDLLAKNSQ